MSPVALAPCLKNQSLLLKRDLFEFKPAKGRHPMHSAACCDLQEVVLLVDLRTLPEAQKALESAVPLPCKVLLDRAGRPCLSRTLEEKYFFSYMNRSLFYWINDHGGL